MNAWSSDPDSKIKLAFGTSSTVHRASCDLPNSFTFDDPFDEIAGSFDCSQGGVVAVGGGCLNGTPTPYGGYELHDFFKGFVITQDGVGCLMGEGGGTLGQEVFGHEIGHNLGLGHSCGGSTADPDCEDPLLDDAMMRPFLHGNGRGARLNQDDKNGAAFLYPQDVRADWWRHLEYPGFRFQIEIVSGGAEPIMGTPMTSCIGETVCVSGAIPGRAEVFTRIIGPRGNGKLWPTLVKFTTSEVIIRIEQIATGVTRTYRLAGARPGVDELPGKFDREGFDP